MSTFRLFRFGPAGRERPAVELLDGRRLDCSAFGMDWGPAFFAEDGMQRLEQWLPQVEASLPEVPADSRFGPCVTRPHKLICIGLNYKDHARETGAKLPPEPVLFFKATSALCGPNDDLVIPKGAQKTDWEVELLVVIGRLCQHVEERDALQHVAGYALHDDYSEREFQLEHHGQWVKGKSCDTFAPIGPYLVPKEQVPDPQALKLWLDVNGRRRQDSSTGEMLFGVAHLVSYVSRFMTLEPGDCISTGTPAGVGLGCTPPEYLQAGDSIACGIDGLGEQHQRAVAWESRR